MFFIAEIGQAHEGSLGMAHAYIDALASTGVNAIKFQVHIAEAESSKYEKFRVKFSLQDKTRFDYWKRMEFSTDEWKGLKKHCHDLGLKFIASPFSNAAVDLLEQIETDIYKIGSGEVTNSLMLNKIAKLNRPVILSSGMSSFYELDKAIELLKRYSVDLSVLQCTTAYPTKPEQWGLNIIRELISRYQLPVGYSDHSGDIFSSLAASIMGAEILEFHAVFDYNMFGPDTKASLTIDKISNLVRGVKLLKESLSIHVNKNETDDFGDLKQIFEKSLAINKDLPKGAEITEDYLEAKKPKGKGIDANEYANVIGKRLNKNKKQWDFLNYRDLK